ncbi:electron transport complex subunit RsxC [Candidatus Fermentibacteria bacterium]|nr:electron transport complex subunit RsxC [Candidatus Fermentibacteria bacterium]
MARLRTFDGGAHPPERKELAERRAVTRLPAPHILRVALCQHMGAPSTPCVQKGDRVLQGQEIGAQNGFISLPTHSPVAGTVTGVEEYPMPHRRSGPVVVIETESEQGEPPFEPWPDFESRSPAEIIERIRLAGICGMGGASFPAYVKLTPPKGKSIDTLILNGAECEPYLTADHRLMLERTGDVAFGMAVLAHALGVKRCFVGVEANKPDAADALRRAGLDVVELRVKYPQGAEKQLIKATTGREVPVGGLPLDIGVVVQNVGTAAAVAEAVRDGMPSIRRITTVSGEGVRTPGNFDVCVGTLFSDLITAAGGYLEGACRLLAGGPMMGIAQFTDAVPVTKGTSGIVALTAGESRPGSEGPCIRCGKCVDTCPMHLVPCAIATAGEHADWEEADRCGALACIACGTCSFVCPSSRFLVHYIKRSQDAVRAMKRAREA